ncbi:MAG: hypothetical protein LBC18_07940 [Opitutaceae bacterium]|jgi:multisubunit Na+/H+ antiporter MnhB subunit|nr:hypothetical protein [Opitutaceae bacterium]
MNAKLMEQSLCFLAAGKEPIPSLIEQQVVDLALLFVGLVVAVAAVWLQWRHFKRSHPAHPQDGSTIAPFGPSPHRRWKNLYWREVRATFLLALISLSMVGFTIAFHKEVTMPALVSVIFWLAMFFYNLWVAQWLAWRIATKRKR